MAHEWDERYGESSCLHGVAPSAFLKEVAHLLPPGGRVLDLAMGEGRNALFLADRGFQVVGVDRSAVAVGRARGLAESRGLAVEGIVADLETWTIPPASFEVILIFNYLQRSLFPSILSGLAKGGCLVYETYTRAHLKYRPTNPDFLLADNELLHAFADLHVVLYREVDLVEERRAIASLLAFAP